MRKRAALMSRVSSDEQAKGYSLGVQSEALETYCLRNDIEIVYSFKEDHSAKNFERPAFKQFLEYLKKNKGSIDLFLFTSWDRFSRNAMDAYHMIDRLKKLGIEAQSIEQPIDFSVPENKMMLAMYLVMPEVDNDRRSIQDSRWYPCGSQSRSLVPCSSVRLSQHT
jgi:site-specific DNA recombinase